MRTGQEKILKPGELKARLEVLKREGKRIVFTNGCFDLLHPGHVRYLWKARQLGEVLVVALNSDASVRRLKGPKRPILRAAERSEMMAALEPVDFVVVFDEETPLSLIETLQPDVLAKGGDWRLDQIVGRETVERAGGKVIAVEFEQGYSTSGLIARIRGIGNDSPRRR